MFFGLHTGKEDIIMKQKQYPDLNDGTGKEEVFRCMSCGSVLGSYGQGSYGTTKCPTCKEIFRFDFQEDCPTLKRITRRVKA